MDRREALSAMAVVPLMDVVPIVDRRPQGYIVIKRHNPDGHRIYPEAYLFRRKEDAEEFARRQKYPDDSHVLLPVEM